MSNRQDKKQRQFYRREFEKEYKGKASEKADAEMNMFKTKPKWVPMFLWIWALGFFIRIKK